jgi:hypothetical protein
LEPAPYSNPLQLLPLPEGEERLRGIEGDIHYFYVISDGETGVELTLKKQAKT